MNREDFEEFVRNDFEGATKLSPIEFARMMGMRPQMVYYYIRNKVLQTERCICGRRVLDIDSAKEALQEKKDKQRSTD